MERIQRGHHKKNQTGIHGLRPGIFNSILAEVDVGDTKLDLELF